MHAHTLYHDDNSKLYYYLEEDTWTTSYADSINPFQRVKCGRGSWLDIRAKYAGVDKWEAETNIKDELLHSRKYKGQINYSLEKHTGQHHNAFISIQSCAEHVA